MPASRSEFAEAAGLVRDLSMSEVALKFQLRWLALILCLTFWAAVIIWVA